MPFSSLLEGEGENHGDNAPYRRRPAGPRTDTDGCRLHGHARPDPVGDPNTEPITHGDDAHPSRARPRERQARRRQALGSRRPTHQQPQVLDPRLGRCGVRGGLGVLPQEPGGLPSRTIDRIGQFHRRGPVRSGVRQQRPGAGRLDRHRLYRRQQDEACRHPRQVRDRAPLPHPHRSVIVERSRALHVDQDEVLGTC